MSVLPYIGIAISAVMLCYGGYTFLTTPVEGFWQNLGMFLFMIAIFWAWIPILMVCIAYLYFKKEEKEFDRRWEENRRHFGFGPSWGKDW